jgi:hypothetical protein
LSGGQSPLALLSLVPFPDQTGETTGFTLSPTWNFALDDLQYFQAPSEPKLFEPKPLKNMEAIICSTIATGILRSIPDMMRRRKTLPPFIHPCCYGSKEDDWKLPASLAKVSMISQMFPHLNEDNRGLMWQTVKMEQERLMSEVSSVFI